MNDRPPVDIPPHWLYVKPGDKFSDAHGPATVMAVAAGWVMMRRKGCVPFCVWWVDLQSDWTVRRKP